MLHRMEEETYNFVSHLICLQVFLFFMQQKKKLQELALFSSEKPFFLCFAVQMFWFSNPLCKNSANDISTFRNREKRKTSMACRSMPFVLWKFCVVEISYFICCRKKSINLNWSLISSWTTCIRQSNGLGLLFMHIKYTSIVQELFYDCVLTCSRHYRACQSRYSGHPTNTQK